MMEARLEKERKDRIDAYAHASLRRMLHGALCHGWTSWVEEYRACTREARATRKMQDVRARLKDNALATPFLHWRRIWKLTSERKTRKKVKTADVMLLEVTRERDEAKAQNTSLTAKVNELEQRVGLLQVALTDEQSAHKVDREKLSEMKQLELANMEASAKRREMEEACEELMVEVEELSRVISGEQLRSDKQRKDAE